MLQHIISEYERAQTALEQRKFDESLALADSLLEKLKATGMPCCKVKTLHFLAEIHHTKGRYLNQAASHLSSLQYLEDAARTLDEAPSNTALGWKNLLLKTRTYTALGRFDQSQGILEQCANFQGIEAEIPFRESQLALARAECRFHQNQYDEAIDSIREAQGRLSESTPAEEDILLECYALALEVLLRRREYAQLGEYAPEVIRMAKTKGDLERTFIGLNALAVFHDARQDYKTAMLHFRDALEIGHRINYRYGIALCLANVGTIYGHLYNYDEALEHYTTVTDEYADVLDDSTELLVLSNIGNTYHTVGKQEEALEYFKRALTLSESMGSDEMQAQILARIGRALAGRGRYEDALAYTRRSEELLNERGYLAGQQVNYITLGDINHHLGNHDQALAYLEEGIARAKRLKDRANEMRGYALMSDMLKGRERYKEALDYQLAYSRVREEHAMEQHNLRIMDLEIRYALQPREREPESLKDDEDRLLLKKENIEEQNRKLKEANKDLTDFAHSVAHDLKEPLRMIGSYSQLIQRRYSEQLEEEAGEFFGYVQDGVHRMERLLEDLLQYAVIGRDETLDWEEVDLSEIMEITRFNLKLAASEADASFDVGDLPKIHTNRSYMSQIFQNMVGNAIKFRRPGVPPLVTVRYAMVGGEHQISFQDNGIGIPPNAIDRIFLIFQRLHKKEKYAGSGVGLSICVKILERLGGSISVESEEGRGTTFLIGLPVESDTASD